MCVRERGLSDGAAGARCEGLPPTSGRVMERETGLLALVLLIGTPRWCGGCGVGCLEAGKIEMISRTDNPQSIPRASLTKIIIEKLGIM